MTADAHIAERLGAAARGDVRVSGAKAVWGYLALAGPAILILADTLWAVSGGWRLDSRLYPFVLGVVGAWVAGNTLALALPTGRRFYTRWFGQCILLSAGICVAWLLAEFLLGAISDRLGDPFHGRRPDTQLTYRPRAGIMRDVGPEAHVSYNSWGVRGNDPPPRGEAYRILCLGGSSTACTYLDDAKTWPHLLEAELNAIDSSHQYWVGNAALPGYRTAHHLQFVEQSPLIEQIDCLVVQAGINDFMAALAGPQPAPPLWTHSRIRRLVGSLARQSVDSGTTVEDTAGEVYIRRRAMRAAAAVNSEPPNLELGLKHFSDNVHAIIDVCQKQELRVVFTTQAALWSADLDAANDALLWFGLLPDGRYLSVEQLAAGMNRYNQTLRAICAARGVSLIDLSTLNGLPSAFYDDCHFTEPGAAQVARLIADWFVEHPTPETKEVAR